MQVDYASAALFLNISMHVSGTSQSNVAWWQYPELRMKAGLDPHTQASTSISLQSSTMLQQKRRDKHWLALPLHHIAASCLAVAPS